MEKLWDLLTFLAVLLAPSLAVIAYFIFYKPIHACQDFMYGRYAIHWTCVGASLAGCFLGPFTLLWPSEFVRTGTTWLLGIGLAFFIALPLVAVVHIPILHYNRSCSIYQYLEDRFRSKFLRYCVFGANILTSLLFCIGILTLSAELAHQSLKLTLIDGYAKRWVCILVLSLLTGATAATGGQKASVFLSSFTLVFEFFVALICAVAMGIYRRQTSSFRISGTKDDNEDNDYDSGGNDTINGPMENGDWFSSPLAPDYRFRTSDDDDASIVDQQNLWLTTFVCLLYFFYVLGCQQTSHQHYCSVSTKLRARFALLSTGSVFLIIWSLIFVLACLMINFFTHPSQLLRNCFSASSSSSSAFYLLTDPYSSLKTFFRATWADTNGASGYFLGCITCVGAFSGLPSSFVSSSTSIYEDLIKPYYCINSDESKQIFVLKILTVVFVVVTTAGALLLSELLLSNSDGQFWLYAKNVFLTLAAWTAPLAALYILAIWLPCTNAKGAVAGLAFGAALATTLCILHLTQFPFDPHVQKPNSLLYRCCDENALGISNGTGYVFDDAINQSKSAFLQPGIDPYRNPISCYGYDTLRNASGRKTTINIGFRFSLPFQAILTFLATIFVGLGVSLVTGRQDIYALDWNLVYWTCNSLDGVRFGDCFRRGAASGFDSHGGTGAKLSVAEMGPGKKKRRQRGPYTTSESFRYSKQGPFPDTTYLNSKVQDYMSTLTKTQT